MFTMATESPSDVVGMQSFIASKLETVDKEELERLAKTDNEVIDTSTLESQTDLKGKCRSKFHKNLRKFVDACLNDAMFPSDAAMLGFKAKMESKERHEGDEALQVWLDDLLRGFDTAFSGCEAEIERKDIDGAFRKLDTCSPHMAAFSLGAKLVTMNAPQKQLLWKFVCAFRKLGRSYRLYLELTEPIMNVIRRETANIITSFQETGTVNWDMLNPITLGMKVLGASPAQDKANIVSRIQSGKLSLVLLIQLMLEELQKNKVPLSAVTAGHTGSMDPVQAEALLRAQKGPAK